MTCSVLAWCLLRIINHQLAFWAIHQLARLPFLTAEVSVTIRITFMTCAVKVVRLVPMQEMLWAFHGCTYILLSAAQIPICASFQSAEGLGGIVPVRVNTWA